MGQDESAGDVVVVDVGLGHVGELDSSLVKQGFDAVDVALGVDDQPHLPVVDEVAAVPELGSVDDGDIHETFPPELGVGTRPKGWVTGEIELHAVQG